MTVIVNNKVHITDSYKEPTDGTFDDCTSEILKNLAAEDSSDSESNSVENNWWTKSNKKTAKHEAETCWNNNNKTTVWISLLIGIIYY